MKTEPVLVQCLVPFLMDGKIVKKDEVVELAKEDVGELLFRKAIILVDNGG